MGEETVPVVDDTNAVAQSKINPSDFATGSGPRPDLFAHLREDEGAEADKVSPPDGPRYDLFAHLREDEGGAETVDDLRAQIQGNVEKRAERAAIAEDEPVPVKKDQTTAYDQKPPAEIVAARALSGQDDEEAKKEGLSMLRGDKKTTAAAPKKVKVPARPSTPPPSVSRPLWSPRTWVSWARSSLG